jgi:hypothetical protein
METDASRNRSKGRKLTETNATFKNPIPAHQSRRDAFPVDASRTEMARESLELDLDLKTSTLPFPLKPLNGMGTTILLRPTVTLPVLGANEEWRPIHVKRSTSSVQGSLFSLEMTTSQPSP